MPVSTAGCVIGLRKPRRAAADFGRWGAETAQNTLQLRVNMAAQTFQRLTDQFA
jgi:hypothetical protein